MRWTWTTTDLPTGLLTNARRAGSQRTFALVLPRWQTSVVVASTLAAFFLLSAALVGQHRAFNSHGWDLAWFDQVIWNTANGRPFENSFAPWNFLGEHVQPILLLYALVYRIHPDVEILLISQVLIGALAAVPLYLGARKALASSTAAMFLVLAFLLARHFHNAMLFDFHPEVMAVMSIFAAFAFLAHGKPYWAAAAMASAFLLKEDAALLALGIAWLFWLYGYRRHACVIVAVALVYFVVVTGVLMPHIRGDAGGPHARWSYLGESGPDIVLGAVAKPLTVTEHLTYDAPVEAIGTLVASQAGLPLASPASLGALPLTVAHLLSLHESESGLQLHYGVLPFALTVVGTTLAVARLSRTRRVLRLGISPQATATTLAAAVLTTELVLSVISGPFGLKFDYNHFQTSGHSAVVREALDLVPSDVSVAAQSGLLPHLSQRQRVWEFPVAFGADYVIIDRKSWWETHGPWSPEMNYDFAVASLPRTAYCLRFDKDGVQVWQLAGCLEAISLPAEAGLELGRCEVCR